MNKKAIELTLNTIVIAMIVVIVALIIIFIFNHYYGKETKIIGGQIDQLEDYDGDGTSNMFDPCPCNADVKENCPTAKDECKTTMENDYKTKK